MLRAARVWWKLVLSRYRLIPSFCKQCGRDVRDFIAPDDIWARIQHRIKRGNVLCYNCFCDLCHESGLESVWVLATESDKKNHQHAEGAEAPS